MVLFKMWLKPCNPPPCSANSGRRLWVTTQNVTHVRLSHLRTSRPPSMMYCERGTPNIGRASANVHMFSPSFYHDHPSAEQCVQSLQHANHLGLSIFLGTNQGQNSPTVIQCTRPSGLTNRITLLSICFDPSRLDLYNTPVASVTAKKKLPSCSLASFQYSRRLSSGPIQPQLSNIFRSMFTF